MSKSRPSKIRNKTRWFQSRLREDLKRSLRTPHIEQLEDRRLMTATPLPKTQDVLNRALFDGQASYNNAIDYFNQKFGGSGSGSSSSSTPYSGNSPYNTSGEGAANAVLNVTEIEPNNTRLTPQLVNFGTGSFKNEFVNLSGNALNLGDTDWFAFDLNKGDILDSRLNASGVNPRVLGLYGPNGEELAIATGNNYFPAPNTSSPRYSDGDVNLTYVIGEAGRYYMRVGDQIGSYTLNLHAMRPRSEQAPAGTQQIIYLDFAGGIVNPQLFNLPLSVARVPPLRTLLPQLGLTAADESRVIDEITARVQSKFNRIGVTGTNGFFPTSGTPGEFGVYVTNSKDNPQLLGQSNVTRIIVGGTQLDFLGADIGLLGIAQSVDVGNFDLSENALVMLDILIDSANTLTRSGTTTVLQSFTELASIVIAHEGGHTFGGVHQDPNNNVNGIMDQFYNPPISSGAGLDLIFGTLDDTPLQFSKDEYAPTGGMSFGGGVSDTITNMAFGLSTSNQSGYVTGTIYNDRNRNNNQNSGEEGLAARLVYADYNDNGSLDASEARTRSTSSGYYSLPLRPGTWTIRAVPDTNWVNSSGSGRTVTVGTTQNVSNISFGQYLPNQSVTGFKWSDNNGDGIRDSNEPGIAGVFIYIDLDGDNRIDVGEPAATTADDGSYSLTPPSSGTYAIREVESPGFIQTFPGGTDQEHTVNFSSGTPLRGLDFGNQPARDYGDAPSPYPTTIFDGGASAGVDSRLTLGSLVDYESNGQPIITALGDDANGLDDEDGVTFVRPIVRGDSQNIFRITANNSTGATAYVSAWVDWNRDGDWNDTGEKVLSDVTGLVGTNNLTFAAPSSALLGNTYARFRISAKSGVGPTGFTSSGEVEDYRVNVTNVLDYAVDDSYTVARGSTNNVLDVQANDFTRTALGQSASIISLRNPTSGVSNATTIRTASGAIVTTNGTTVTFTPLNGFQGIDTFTYTIRTSTGATDTATVTVNTVFTRINPVAIDDSFDINTNVVAYPLNVLLNDLPGVAGPVTISGFTQPLQLNNSGTQASAGLVTLGQGGLSLRYTPAQDFAGTAQFTYTVNDSSGAQSTATVTIHTLQGDRDDDLVEFSFRFTDLAGTPITAVAQGQQFKVDIYTDDLRAVGPFQPGVSSAYLDLLYNAGLVRPQPGSSSNFDFDVEFHAPYTDFTLGSNALPGLISDVGASALTSISTSAPVPVATITFTALNAGVADFIGDPADNPPDTDVNLFDVVNPNPGQPNDAAAVPVQQVRYRRSSLTILPSSAILPVAVDDSLPTSITPNSFSNVINVLRNDIIGNSKIPDPDNPGSFLGPSIQITNVGNGLIGNVSINDNGTPNIGIDDYLLYTPNASTANFVGTDQFTYTITDLAGISSTATVTLQIGTQSNGTSKLAELRLEATSTDGTPITTIGVGKPFQLRGYVRDLRSGGTNLGVYAAYQDILLSNPSLVTINSSTGPLGFDVSFADGQYREAVSGNTRITGLIDELGSTLTGNDPIGPGLKLQFIINLTAKAAGVIDFINDPADVSPFHDTLIYELSPTETRPLTAAEVLYTRDRLTIGSEAAGEGYTNAKNRYDVNNDGHTSPIDALLIINSLNRSGIRNLRTSGEGEQSSKMYLDVNGDGYVSPVDVLQIINQLNKSRASGEGESSVIEQAVSDSESSTVTTDIDSILNDVATDVNRRKRK